MENVAIHDKNVATPDKCRDSPKKIPAVRVLISHFGDTCSCTIL